MAPKMANLQTRNCNIQPNNIRRCTPGNTADRHGMKKAFEYVRKQRSPILVHASTPLLGHHTSGVRKEWYRGDFDLDEHQKSDPIPKLRKVLKGAGYKESEIIKIEDEAKAFVQSEYARALNAEGRRHVC